MRRGRGMDLRRDKFVPSYASCPLILAIIILSAGTAIASDDELPGVELTQERFDAVVRRGVVDAAAGLPPAGTPAAGSWLEEAMSTWHAPPLEVQLAANETIIPFGKGGIFVPRYTEMNAEPDAGIFNMNGVRLGSIRTGVTIALEPGEYDVYLGSGTHQQRMIRRVTVEEGRITPVIPDWSGLVIEVVDEFGAALKGEYELVRIDDFDPYGRGYGASIELGETVKAWILKPGIYKILGAGESYSTMTNFVTVRLMPGELTSFLLIQDPDDFHIKGGGTLHMTPTTRIASNWHLGANIGANVLFNSEHDHEAGIGMNSMTMGLLFDAWLRYRKKPMEWSTRLRLEESVNIVDIDAAHMINSPDRLVMSSMYIWRILDWFGPYGRAEFTTKFFDTKIRRNRESHFCFVDRDYMFDETRSVDTALIFNIESALSPLIFELGAGVNADLATRRYLESKVRVGFGSTYSRYGDRYRVIEASRVLYASEDSVTLNAQKVTAASGIVLYPEEKANIFETGPQSSFSVIVRIGAFATAEAEVKLFAPVIPEPRLSNPDFDFNGTFSWRLSSLLNLDYTYRQTLRQPSELSVPVHTSSHGIWLRLHFSSR